MRVLYLSFVIAALAQSDDGSTPTSATGHAGKPILTTDIFHRTAELFYDLYDSFHGKFLKPHIDQHAETVTNSVASLLPKDVDVVHETCQVLKCDAQQVRSIGSTGQDYVKEGAGTVLSVLAQLEELLNRYTHFIIDSFETALPKYTGLISRTPMNLLLFVLYIFSVLYFIFKICMVSLWMASGILCCLCCCGCRCLRKKAQVETKAKNGKTGKESKAAEKGKAATATNKAQAKPKK
ncbi:unnamed protein product [Durusdinium trenchii]|uniref:Uncharacterized protein n=2 Tax=Durusdinium trenchii TaxID=1381693 RepID=A0ABP0QW22_9DINO